MGRLDLRKRLGLLLGGVTAVWVAALYPGWLLAGTNAWLHASIALGMCLLPAMLTLWWIARTEKSSPETVMFAVLGASGLRLAVVLGLGMLLTTQLPEQFPRPFWIWVGLFYLATLALESYLVVNQGRQTQNGTSA